jgi:COX assembly mitochondrial protein 1
MSGDVVSKKAEAGIRYKMKKQAVENCREQMDVYAQCIKGRSLSILVCRQQLKALNECLNLYTSDETLEKMKQEFAREHPNK